MVKLFYILIAILILGFIVVIHELGHYIVGRLCGIGIVEFSVGFGPKLFGWKRKGIQYSLRAVPLGGFCKFVGEDAENSAPDAFNNAPVWKRFLTVAAGPVMNFILAFVFCILLLCNYVISDIQPRIDVVHDNTPAAEAGLTEGDLIRSINGEDITFDINGVIAIQNTIRSSGGEVPLSLSVDRGGEILPMSITPALVTDEASGETMLQIGISFSPKAHGFGEALSYAPKYMVEYTKEILVSLKNLIFKGEGTENVMSAVGMIDFMSDLVYNEKLYAVVNIIFVISLNLGIMNLLPLPALDGGRLVLYIIEAIRKKPLPPEKEGMVHGIGFMLLIAVFIFFAYKDILRIFAGA